MPETAVHTLLPLPTFMLSWTCPEETVSTMESDDSSEDVKNNKPFARWVLNRSDISSASVFDSSGIVTFKSCVPSNIKVVTTEINHFKN